MSEPTFLRPLRSYYRNWLLLLVVCIFISGCRAQKSELDDPISLNLWVSASIGDDTYDGSLDAPLKTFEKALNVSFASRARIVVLNLSPGNYSLVTWTQPPKTDYTIQRCLICPDEPTLALETVVLGFVAPENFALAQSIHTYFGSLSFYNISMRPLPNKHGDINTFAGIISSYGQMLSFSNVDISGFVLSSPVSPLSLVVTRSGTIASFHSVHWFENFMNVSGIDHRPSFISIGRSLAAFGGGDDTLILDNCFYENNIILHDAVAGGMASGFGKVYAMRSRFETNVVIAATLSWGGIFSIPGAAYLQVSDCWFEDNRAASRSNYFRGMIMSAGGAIHFTPSSTVSITNTTFFKNQAFAGGALAGDSIASVVSGQLSISGCTFSSNVAAVLGAAIYLEAAKLMVPTISNCTFDANLLNAEADSRFFGSYSPSTVYIHHGADATIVNNLVFIQHTYFPIHGYRLNHRISIVGCFSVRIFDLHYSSISVRQTEGDLLILQDIPELFVSNLSFSSVIDESGVTRSTNPCLVLIDANSDNANIVNVLLLSNIRISALDLLSATPYFHIRNTDWVFIENFDVHHDAQGRPPNLLFLHNLHSTEITNMKLNNIRSQLIFQEISDVQIVNIHVEDSGFALPVFDFSLISTVTITNSTFADTSTPVRAVDVERFNVVNSQWKDCSAGGNNGGAVSLSSVPRSTFTNCSFCRNSASNGGAVFSWDSVIFQDCNFFNNTAAFAGGAFYGAHSHIEFKHCELSGNISPIGGAIYLQGSDLIIDNSVFEMNEATIASGGAIQTLGRPSSNPSPVLIADSTFRRNYARSSGGAIDVRTGTRTWLADVVFEENVAGPREILDLRSYSTSEFQPLFGSGGAFHGSGALYIDNCQFFGNLANTGGAIVLTWDSLATTSLYIGGSDFVANVAAHSGGALAIFGTGNFRASKPFSPFAELPNTTIESSRFVDNSAYYYGGAIQMQGLPLNMSCGANQFINSTAKYGGALFYNTDSLSLGMPYIRSHHFVGNRAVAGGVAFISMVNSTLMTNTYRFCAKYNACILNRVEGYGPIIASSKFEVGWIERLPGNFNPLFSIPINQDPEVLPWPLPDAIPCTPPPIDTAFTRSTIKSTDDSLSNDAEMSPKAMEMNLIRESIKLGDWSAWRAFSQDLTHEKVQKTRFTRTSSDNDIIEGHSMTVDEDLSEIDEDDYDWKAAYAKEMEISQQSLEALDEDISKLVYMESDDFLGKNFASRFGSSLEAESVAIAAEVSSRPGMKKGFHNMALELLETASDSSTVIYDSFGPVPIHSGVTRSMLFQATDQFGQMVADGRTFPLGLVLWHELDVCASPTHCGGVKLVTVGSTPLMLNGAINLEINLVLDDSMNPLVRTEVNVTVYFLAISESSPMSWLSNMFFTLNFVLEHCPPGYGFLEHGKPYCQICPYSTFNLNGNGICYSCADEANLQCYGSNLMTDDDYWIYSNTTTNSASVYLCPSGYCLSRSNTCAPHRTGRLCAACEPGYSESLFTACTKCNNPNWLLLSFVFVLMWLVILILHTLVAVSSGKSTILFYFVQTAILFASDVPFPWKNSDTNSSLCLFPMTPLTRRLVLLLVPVVMMLQIMLTFAAHRIYINLINPLLPSKYQLAPMRESAQTYISLPTDLSAPQHAQDEKSRKTNPKNAPGSQSRMTADLPSDIDEDNGEDRNRQASSIKTARRRQLTRVDSFSSVEPSYAEPAFLDSSPSSIVMRNNQDTSRWGEQGNSKNALRLSPSASESEGAEESDFTEEEFDPRSPARPNLLSSQVTSDDSESDAFGVGRLGDHETGLGSDSDDSDENPDFLSHPVPAFGFELSDEEETDIDAELVDWKVMESDNKLHEQFLRSERKRIQNASAVQSLPTLSALRRWMFEKRYFHHFRLIRTLLALTSFTYSSMSTFVFTVFDCISIRGTTDKFLKAQPDMLCGSDDFKPWRNAAISFAPILFAFFLSICYKLFSGFFKRRLTQSDVRFGIFYEMYKPEFFFWKIIELLRRSALTAIIVFINDQAITRGLILSGACFAILVAQALAWPFRRKLENSLETLSTFILAVISIAAIWHAKDTSSAASIIIWVLIFCTTAIILIAFTVSTLRRKILPFLRKRFSSIAPSP